MAEVQRRSRQVNARRLVIDPIEGLTRYGDLIGTREFACYLVPSMEKALRTTNVLTARLPTSAISLDAFNYEGIRAAGIMILGLTWADDQVTRSLFVQKMEWTNCRPGIYRFEIERMKGICLLPQVAAPHGEGIEGDALTGSDLPPPPLLEDDEPLRRCPRCGAENPTQYRYCQKCGQMLPR